MMAYPPRHNGWISVRNMFRNKRFIRLRSSSQIEPLLNDYLQSTDSQFDRDYENSLNELHRRNFDLEKKIDEVLQKANDIKSRYIKIERNHADNYEAINKKNSDLQSKLDELARKVEDLQSSNKKNDNLEKVEIENIERKNAILEDEIRELKGKVAALEVKMNDTDAKDAILKSLVSIRCKDIKDMKGSSSPNEILIGIIVLIFLVCFLIGMQI